MNNKKRLKELKRLRVLILAGIMSSSLKVGAYSKDLNFVYGEDAKYATEVENQIKELPHNLSEYLEDTNISVFLLDDKNGAENTWRAVFNESVGSIRGFTDVEGNAIYIEATDHEGYYEKYSDSSKGLSKEEFNKRLAIDTTIHELGHVIDMNTDYLLSSSSEFENIFYEEAYSFRNTEEYQKENLKINANINTPLEYWATAFACYVKYPEDLSIYCPQTYRYMNNYFKTIETQYPSIEEDEEIEIIEGNNNGGVKYLTKEWNYDK